MNTPKCFLDACLLYSDAARNYLLNLSELGVLEVYWSKDVLLEWERSVKKVDREKIKASIELMNYKYPQSLVEDYSSFIESIKLYDPDDRHVVAAAHQSNSSIILTFNTKDFPFNRLAPFDVEAIQPDIFLAKLYKHYPEQMKKALGEWTIQSLKDARLIKLADKLRSDSSNC